MLAFGGLAYLSAFRYLHLPATGTLVPLPHGSLAKRYVSFEKLIDENKSMPNSR